MSLKEKFQCDAKSTRASKYNKNIVKVLMFNQNGCKKDDSCFEASGVLCFNNLFFLLVPESISFVLFKFSTSRLKHNYLKLILVRMIFTIF